MTGRPTVLCVDDEPNVLNGLRLSLRKHCEILTAESGAAALALLSDANETGSTIDVIVSDMQMPGMNGAELLTQVRTRHPDTVRVLLTGHADLDAALAAINDAKVFRFLTKPCPPGLLVETVVDAGEQRRLQQAERQLLDQTVRGSVAMMTDVLGLVNTSAHHRTMRVAGLVAQLCTALNVEYDWELEVSALVSQLGGVVVPEQDANGQDPGNAAIAAALLRRIPRLEGVAEIVEGQTAGAPHAEMKAELLRVAVRFDGLLAGGLRRTAAIEALAESDDRPEREVLDALRAFQPDDEQLVDASVSVGELVAGMHLTADVMTASGSKLAASGTVLTTALLRRIEAFAASSGVHEPIEVLAPARALARLVSLEAK